jgi:hypothetical protein
VATPFGWVAARQSDQLLLDVPLDLDLVRAGWLGLVVQGREEALGDKALADAGDGSGAAPKAVMRSSSV